MQYINRFVSNHLSFYRIDKKKIYKAIVWRILLQKKKSMKFTTYDEFDLAYILMLKKHEFALFISFNGNIHFPIRRKTN